MSVKGSDSGYAWHRFLILAMVILVGMCVIPAAAKTVAISGTKYLDKNGDGIQQGTESGLGGWTIDLYNQAGGFLQTTKTSTVDGNYTFAVNSGTTYVVKEENRAGWTHVNPASGQITVVVANADQKKQDFGNSDSATIIGRKYNDANANGIHEDTEEWMNGWEIWLTDSAENKYKDETDPQTPGETQNAKMGFYCFGLCKVNGITTGNDMYIPAPATYTLSEGTKPNWAQTEPPNPDYYEITVVGGQVINTGLLFGNAETGKICGFKLDDKNVGLGEWTIILDPGPDELTTQTGSDGGYCFNMVIPGDHIISEGMKPNWVQLEPSGGSYEKHVDPGQKVEGVNFVNKEVLIVVPEFPTVGVSVAILIGIGFMVVTLRQKKD